MSICNRCGATVSDIPCYRCGAYHTEEVIAMVDGMHYTPGPRKSEIVERAAVFGLTRQQMRVRMYGAWAAALLASDDEATAPSC